MGECVFTIHHIKNLKIEETIDYKHRISRLKKLTKREKKIIIRKKKKDLNILVTNLASMIADNLKKDVYPELCWCILRRYDFHSRIPRKKPFIGIEHSFLILCKNIYLVKMQEV